MLKIIKILLKYSGRTSRNLYKQLLTQKPLMLSIIGIGLNDEKDITVKGLELVKNSDFIYLENYTSKLQCSLENLENFYGKNVTLVERTFVEDGQVILDQAQENNVCLLIIGDIFSATTHISLYQEAKDRGIHIKLVNNASILTVISITGLSLYKFGKTTSIPFHETDVPLQVIKENFPLHTLCLLDLNPKENKFMESKEAIELLKNKGFDINTKVVVCAQLGSENSTIIYTEAKNIKSLNKFPQCLIIPGEMHFIEKELIERYN